MFSQSTVERVNTAFINRFKAMSISGELKDIIFEATGDEKVCLKFLYAFMPASDIISYPAELFVQIVRQALSVREQNIFGETIPDEVFLNYVLQCRINNENLEYNRDYFFAELHPRIKSKTAIEAAIEVNYWCLEKVTYIGNNQRTMSPLTLMKNTMGRCGEESLFTVSAFRSVGIPARQIYTPRWAHCESNHAWVEVYVGGEWHFLGACEPEPVLNKGWFTGPAAKGMLVYAKTFSTMPSPDEEIAYKTELACEVNRTNFYVQNTAKLSVLVKNGNKDIKVHVAIVSFCSFATLIALTPDDNGMADVTIGKGDILVTVTDGSRFISRQIDMRREQYVEIDFALAGVSTENASYIFNPPFSDYKDPDYGLSADDMAAHDTRVSRCHEIRKAYAATFADEARGGELAKKCGLDYPDAAQIFVGAKGNLDEIVRFMEMSICDITGKTVPVKYKYLLLTSLQAKDLTDSIADILSAHLAYAMAYVNDFDEEIFKRYILCPRIEAVDMITPYRPYIYECFNDATVEKFRQDPRALWQWIQENINNADEYRTDNDHRILSAFPIGMLMYRYGGEHSRKILFVAICRTLGIPARLSSHDFSMEYFDNGKFIKVVVEKEVKSLFLTVVEKNGIQLEYYGNYSLRRLVDAATPYFFNHDKEQNRFELAPGHYQLLTGRRFESGAMSVKTFYVHLTDNTTIEVETPAEEKTALEPKPIGDYDLCGTKLSSLLTGKDLVACIRPSHEPTEHLLKELLEAREDYKRLGVHLVLVTLKDNDTLHKVKTAFEGDITIIHAPDDAFGQYLADKTGLHAANLPVMAMVKGGNAVYYMQGYNVGSAAMALTVI